MWSEQRIETFDDRASLMATCGPWLAANEAEHNVLLDVQAASRATESREHFVRVVDADDTQLVAILTRRRLQLSRASSLNAVTTLATALGPRPDEVAVVAGPTDVAAAFAKAWERVTCRRLRLGMLQRIYALRTRPRARARTSSGSLRPAAYDDRELLSDWIVAFAEEARLPMPDRDAMRASIAVRTADGTLFVWDDQGVVSMAALVRTTPRGGGVSLVYTPPSLRGRGYAGACVASVSTRILTSGKHFCFLYTDHANPSSNGIYRALGYEPVADAAVWVQAG